MTKGYVFEFALTLEGGGCTGANVLWVIDTWVLGLATHSPVTESQREVRGAKSDNS
jgi:hypothetical protein